MTDPTPIAGCLLGLASSVHCVVMCGGVASALDRLSPPSRTPADRIRSQLLYAFGRVTSYALVGAFAGCLGFVISRALVLGGGASSFPLLARWGIGILLIMLGLGLTGLVPLLGSKNLGHSIWRRMRPLAGPVMRLPRPLQALGIGALWGLLPCGMVYSAAAVAAVTGSVGQGALFMTAFGLGTVPAVVSTGTIASGIWQRLGRQNMQRASAFGVVLCGVWMILGPIALQASAHAHHP